VGAGGVPSRGSRDAMPWVVGGRAGPRKNIVKAPSRPRRSASLTPDCFLAGEFHSVQEAQLQVSNY